MNKILIMDSQPDTLDILSKRLSYYGYEVLTANSGMSGLTMIKFFMPDLVILSTQLSDMSGYDVCKKIKENEETKYILVLFISNLNSKDTNFRALEVGADDFIEKEFDSVVLISKVKSLLRINHLMFQLNKNYSELKEKDKILDHQLKMARQVQRSLIKKFDFDFNDVTFYSRYLSALDIGGDFYNILELSDDCIGVIIGDVSGHGISAALLTSMMLMMFQNLSSKFLEPDELLFNMNNQFYKIFEKSNNEMYSCVFYAVIDTSKKLISYSNAGQCLPIFVTGNNLNIMELESTGMPIGLMKDSTYEHKTINYDKNDLLLFYTDGLSDNFFKEHPEEFAIKLRDLLLDTTVNESATDIVNLILDTFYNLNASENEKLNLDDVSIILCKT